MLKVRLVQLDVEDCSEVLVLYGIRAPIIGPFPMGICCVPKPLEARAGSLLCHKDEAQGNQSPPTRGITLLRLYGMRVLIIDPFPSAVK